MNNMDKKLLIFDLDGTLADTLVTIRDSVNMALEKNQLPLRTYDEVMWAIGNGARELMRKTVPAELSEDSHFIDRIYEDYNEAYNKTFANLEGCYPFVSEVLHTLKDRGYTLAVLSNKPDFYTKRIVEALFSDGTVSFAAGQTELPRKPDPTVPLMIAERFGVSPSECAFIGDSEVDVMTAKNSGMTSVACSWGYRPREALADADFIIDDARELLSIFK